MTENTLIFSIEQIALLSWNAVLPEHSEEEKQKGKEKNRKVRQTERGKNMKIYIATKTERGTLMKRQLK